MESPKPATWKPMLAGILNITVGTVDLLSTLGLAIVIAVVGTPELFPAQDIYPMTVSALNAMLTALAVYLGIAGLIAITGGIFALQRKTWGLALAGSIAAALTGSVLGMASIVFLAISKDEFV
jgi:hypothetical protein